MLDILKEMLIERIEDKVVDFMNQKDIYEYNSIQLKMIVEKLRQGGDLNLVEKGYLEIFELI